MNLKTNHLTSSLICALLLNTSSFVLAADTSTSEPTKAPTSNAEFGASAASPIQKQATTSSLPNGLYLVFNEADDEKKLNPIGKQQIVLYDYQFFPLSDRDQPTFLTISPEEFIPLKLAGDPQKEQDAQGKPKLLLQLANDQITPLKEFSTKNLGKAVAIVIGSKVVTKHKIKEAITGGKMQITRCSDNGCDVLYTQLKQNQH
ncbi:MAG: hypothetical protein SGJ27_30430 [Candidatus Melainabacteria bacterium]|nr:hypothetical protein [Candidatus Melainabacteria bacterium]